MLFFSLVSSLDSLIRTINILSFCSISLFLFFLITLFIFFGLFLFCISFLIPLTSGVVNNFTTLEYLRNIDSQDYLSINPYFNFWDFGFDSNIRQLLNSYNDERTGWYEPTGLSKLLENFSQHNELFKCSH